VSIPEEIVAGVKYLDEFGPCEWRNKVIPTLDSLDMFNGSNCILGKIYGNYLDGKETLRSYSGYPAWKLVRDCFNNHTAEWKDYLSSYGVTPLSEDPFKNADYVGKISGTKIKTDHSFTRHGVTYVVYMDSRVAMSVVSQREFEAAYKPVSKYIEGQLYKGKKGKETVLMYTSTLPTDGRPGFYNLLGDAYCSVTWYEENYGPLTPIYTVDFPDTPVIAKIGIPAVNVEG
jgi:hypothetical protein